MRRLLRSPRKPDVLAAPGNAGIARDKVECVPVEVEDIAGLVDLARTREVDLVVVGPEVPLVLGLVDALAGGRHPRLRPVEGGRPARGIQALRQGADGGRRRAHRGLRGADLQGPGARGDRPLLLPAGAQGRLAGRGQGRDHLRRRGGRAGGHRHVLHRAPLRRHRGGARGVPGRRGAVAAGRVRRRARGGHGAGPGLQAHLRRRRGPQHRRDGQLLAGARHRRRPRRCAGPRGPPADRGRDEAPRHPVPRDPVRGADDDRRRRRRCWSTTAASATPRPRPC